MNRAEKDNKNDLFKGFTKTNFLNIINLNKKVNFIK